MKEIFPTNPIQEVIVEIKFPLNLRITKDICEFQDIIKLEYPSLTLEELILSEMPTDIRYIFQNDQQTHSIFVEREKFFFISSDRYNFDSFSSQFLPIFEHFIVIFHIKQITSVRLNFINTIDGDNDNYSTLSKYVIPPLGIDLMNLPNDTKQFAVQAVKQKGECVIITSGALIPGDSPELKYSYILDIDSIMESETNCESLYENLNILNKYIYNEFLLNITEDFRRLMRKNDD